MVATATPIDHDTRIGAPEEAAWAANETYEAMAGFWDALPISWVSPPKAIETVDDEDLALPAAHAAGLVIPETLVTSDPQEARAFIDRLGPDRVICKAFSATESHWRETRQVGAAEYGCSIESSWHR